MSTIAQSAAAPQGMVYTFYSYKGGVGRSMALANVAALLARWGKKVLIIDWDLEAPGIERFFGKWLLGQRRTTDGLVELIHSATAPEAKDWRSCVLWAALEKSERIAILHAGRDDEGYAERLRDINWDELFEKHRFAYFLEDLRERWIREFDFVLIDSRTGITDIGGVCSIYMPDVLVTLFTATEQSLEGVRDVMLRAREKHAALPVERRHLLIVPIPARDESGSEYRLAAEWRRRFAGALNDFFVDWMPRDETSERILNHLKIPYFAYWSFGERLPAIEEDADNPKTLAFSYQLVARLLLGKLDWKEVRKGTQSAEAVAAQNVAAEEKTAEAARVRAQAQQAEAEREAARAEQEKFDIKKRLDQFMTDRVEPIRRSMNWSLRFSVYSGIAGLAAFLLAMWRGNFLFPGRDTRGDLNGESVVLLGLVGVLYAVGTLFLTKRQRQRRVLNRIDSEAALYRSHAGDYALDSPTSAFRKFVERSEEHIVSDDRASAVVDAAVSDRPLPRDHDGVAGGAVVAAPSVTPAAQRPTDILISYRQSHISEAWLKEFLPLFTAWVAEFTGRSPYVSVYKSGPDESAEYEALMSQVLPRTKCYIPIVSKAYFASSANAHEWSVARNLGIAISPIALTPGDLPEEVGTLRVMDFSAFAFVGEGFSKTERYVEFQKLVREMAQRVAEVLDKAPAAK